MSYIAWFKELTKDSIPTAGGKGANLAEMYKLGVPVPNGFAITAQCYQEFVTKTGLQPKILALLNNLDPENNNQLQKVSEQIQELVVKTPLPHDMAEEIVDAYGLLGASKKIASEIVHGKDTFVAVRSSATAEDLPSASFAGQQATFLNVIGKDNVLHAVLGCWASLFTARAIYYRQKNNFEHSKVLISAIVQKMVNSEKAGIMFTINPATNNGNEIVVESIYGLGEMIVGGEVNPDLYIINKSTKDIAKREIRKQTEGLFRNSVGMNEKLYIPPSLQEKQKITDTQIKELAAFGQQLENHYSLPQDIEWAVEDEKVYIVQTRAITTYKKSSVPTISTTNSPSPTNNNILLHGETASAGFYSGIVKVVNNPQELSKITKGDILVTEMTTPDMVPAMQRAGAIITNAGGMTCIEGEANILTDKGFVKMKDVGNMLASNIPLKTLSVDSKTKKVVWRPIICSMKRKSRSLEIVPYLNSSNDLDDTIKITADHKMPFLEGDTIKSLPLQDVLAQSRNLIVIDRIPRLEKDIDLTLFDQNKLMYLCGSLFSDGHIVKRKSGRPMRVTFSQKITPEKERYINTVTTYFNSLFGAELRNYTSPESLVHYQGAQWSRAASFECSQSYPAQTLQTLKNNFVQVMSSIEEKYIISFLGGLIDGDGHFNKEKASIEIYTNKKDTTLIQSIVIACLRLNILAELSNPKKNLIKFNIKDKVNVITSECKRVKAVEREIQGRKLFDLKVFDSLQINDWRGSLYQYKKNNSFVSIEWLSKYLSGHCSKEKLIPIENLLSSDFRMQRAAILGETEEIDVYNMTIQAQTEEDHNYIIFTKHYTPLFVYNCHAAIVSREMGTPCIVGTEKATHLLKDGQIVTVDATAAVVYDGRMEAQVSQQPPAPLAAIAPSDILTATKIKVILDLPQMAQKAAATGADGVGLVRLEIIIAQGSIHPAEYIRQNKTADYVKHLRDNIRIIAQAFDKKPVWVRCSDMRSDEYRNLVGGDKEPKETDPMIGWHAIRRLLDEPQILQAEFQAIKELHDEGLKNVGIMIPFVIRTEEVRKAKEIMRKVGLEPCKDIQFGIMVETPASCWIIEDLCKEGISFVSFGTNDLTQLTLGIDRNNERLSKLFDEMHPAVLGEIARVIKTCKKYGVTTSICGQAGSRPEMAEFLVHQGVDSISTNADAVATIRRTVARVEKKLMLEAERHTFV